MRYVSAETGTEKNKMYKKGLNTRIKLGMSGQTYYTLKRDGEQGLGD
jgi:hypothetical protein